MTKIWQRFRSYHPVIQAFLLMAPVALTTGISRLIMTRPKDKIVLNSYLIEEIEKPASVINFVVWEPVMEELIYRGPIWILMLLIVLIAKHFSNSKVYKYSTWSLLILALIISSVLWAIPHIYPLTFFLYGCVLGYIILRTRSVFSLLYTIIFHMTMNSIALISLCLGFNRSL